MTIIFHFALLQRATQTRPHSYFYFPLNYYWYCFIAAGNTNSDFAIDGTTGVVTVAATNGLDRSTTPHYALVIHATDSGTPALSGVTTLSIIVSASDSAAAMNVVSLLSLVAVGLGHMLV